MLFQNNHKVGSVVVNSILNWMLQVTKKKDGNITEARQRSDRKEPSHTTQLIKLIPQKMVTALCTSVCSLEG